MCFVYVTHELMHKIRLSNKVWHSFILVHPLLNPPPKSCERKSKPKKNSFVYVTRELMHTVRLRDKVWDPFILVHVNVNQS